MTQEEAIQLAEKREKHKSKNMRHMSWQPVEENGVWSVKLLETPQRKIGQAVKQMDQARADAAVAIVTGDINALMVASRMHLLARCDAIVTKYESVHGKVERPIDIFDTSEIAKTPEA